MKRELRREVELGKSEEGSSGPSRNIEKPLPQRIPKPKLKVISNIQVAPPKIVEKKVGFMKHSSDGNKTDSSRQDWSEVVNRKSKNVGRENKRNLATPPPHETKIKRV
ncbi:hypothetical protein RF55_10321 [Lasius niger]|uniref:Uncharacterized protein n=1 Tax=Lasius niger TaxID=67767 RepID=A0A0J7NBI3_LASNI|nr:hypothetical protein RF55_10321 [Lasius niger]